MTAEDPPPAPAEIHALPGEPGAILLMGAGILLMGGALAAIGVELIVWLKTADWLGASFSSGLGILGIEPGRTSWTGVQWLLDGLWSLPLWLALLMLSLAALLLGLRNYGARANMDRERWEAELAVERVSRRPREAPDPAAGP